MAKEQFFYPETQPLFKQLETLRQRSGVSRGQAFEDWLLAVVAALAAETMEAPYLDMVERHKKGKPGKRGIDLMGQMFGELVLAMEKNDADILGDLFEGAITHGENSLYLTPSPLAQLMAQLTVQNSKISSSEHLPIINDCCCGTGRMLLEAAKINPAAELVGQDIDARCARITAINLALRGLYGWVLCGNTLSGETQFAYRIGHFYHESPNGLRRGMIREVPPVDTPVPFISERLQKESKDLFQQDNEPEEVIERELPAVIEIPRWIASLERTATTLDTPPQSATSAAPPPAVPQHTSKEKQSPVTQQRLFE